MKSALAVVIIASLIASPCAGCATARGPRQIDEVAYQGEPVTSNWSRVGEVKPGAEIVVRTRGSQAASRYFVMADEARLIVLNLTAPSIPARSTRVLRDMAAHHPEYFGDLEKTGAVGQDNIRLGRDGLFVGDRKIADLKQVMEAITRNDVDEIWGPVVARGSVIGAVVGGWVGFAVGAVPGLGGAPEGLAWLLLIGSIAAGASLGSHWTSHETEGIVYMAP